MKIYIGQHRGRITWPFKVNEWYFAKRFGKFNYDYDKKDYKWFDHVVDKSTDWIMVPINKFINFPWLDKRERKVKVRIDNYDVWAADNTIALIVHPMLIKLREDKHGSPIVDDVDVPDHLRSTAASPKTNDWDTDDLHEARWDWVLDEMIWAFKQCATDDYGDNQFYSGDVDWTFDKDSDTGLTRFGYGPSSTFKVDTEGKKEHYDRIQNGLRLFARYYMALWT